MATAADSNSPRPIRLAEALALPADAVTQTFLIVGKRGSGKSNTAARFVEQLYRAGLPFVVLDPVDTWWGLKATADGQGKGLGVYVFGGRHADLPLEPGAGALLAGVLCEHRIPMVLSVKHLSGRQRSAFMVAFASTLFQKWTGGPLHVVLEEAHELAPQIGARGGGEDGEAAMLGAFKRLWKLGRASGIGGTAITQRPASLSKDITTQSEILIAHRTIGPQDVAAVGEWVKYHGEHGAILAELPTLPTGEAFIWAPEFPEGRSLGLQRVKVARRETFDSASTPRVGETRTEPREFAAVDLDRLREHMAETLERAEAEDPRALRARILELERSIRTFEAKTHTNLLQNSTAWGSVFACADPLEEMRWAYDTLRNAGLAQGVGETFRACIERSAKILEQATDPSNRNASGLPASVSEMAAAVQALALSANAAAADVARRMQEAIAQGRSAINAYTAMLAAERNARRTPQARHVRGEATPPTPVRVEAPGDIFSLDKIIAEGGGPVAAAPTRAPRAGGQALPRAILTALAQHPDGLTKEQILIHSGYAANGKVSTAFATLLANGHVQSPRPSFLVITPPGLRYLGPFEPLPTGAALRRFLLEGDKFNTLEKALLRPILEAYPSAVTKGQILELAGYAANGKVSSAFAKLTRLGYVRKAGPGSLVAARELFT
jgi:hypothetical protein